MLGIVLFWAVATCDTIFSFDRVSLRKMSSRASGGLRSTVPPRKRAKRVDRKETAYIRVCEKLGEDTVKKIRSDWDQMNTRRDGSEWQQSEGIVIQFLQQGLSEREIRAVIPVGGSRIARLRKVLEEGVETLHTRREPQRPWHALVTMLLLH
ncbi:uncharacterized protein PITG_22996 [Phytophthora infestans T30-4]|uniref:Secreted RxLR effector peptide protein n=1 Tax=Phytophthora infestans (strain T30-4) TaxID=403677 RepID=D0NLS3_PHYIT|nr:uncharacterized protein PITG_22996 [Phytophthora infestans T30-4]EEY60620.1 conserved hypothetical protein [Phytophthora infestans T30-4]|eukprot:XP_002899993.1 conserved hypothetical protein [Phytophthora infestans T30-4]